MRATTLTLFDPAFLGQLSTPNVTPAIFNPVRWYDSSSFVSPVDGTNVVTWDDSAPADDDATTTVTREPTLKTNIINGLPVVRFGGVDHLVFEGGDLLLQDFTILVVHISTLDSIFMSRSDGANRQLRVNRSGQPRASWFTGSSGQELISNSFLSNPSQPRMVGFRREGGIGLPRTFRFFDNLTEVLPTTDNVDNTIFQIDRIGSDAPLNSDIAELVIFDTGLANDEIRTLYNSYFKPKFALP